MNRRSLAPWLVLGLASWAGAAIAQEKVYVADKAGKIWRYDYDGTGKLEVETATGTGVAFNPLTEEIYWGKPLNGLPTVYRSNADGTGSPTHITTVNDVTIWATHVDPVERYVYWTALNDCKIRRADIDTGITQLLRSGSNSCSSALELDLRPSQRKLYWADNGSVFRADLDGSNAVSVAGFGTIVRGVAVDPVNDHIYAVGLNASKFVPDTHWIKRCNLDGTGLTTILISEPGFGGDVGYDAHGIAVDAEAGYIFWTSDRAGFRRANLDGSNPVLFDSIACRGIDLDMRRDCNGNGIPDDEENDCNCNGIDDLAEIAADPSLDCNSNGLIDECEGIVSDWVGPGSFTDAARWTGGLPHGRMARVRSTNLANHADGTIVPLCGLLVEGQGGSQQRLQIGPVSSIDADHGWIRSDGIVRLTGGILDGSIEVEAGGRIDGEGEVHADLVNRGRVEADVPTSILDLYGAIDNTGGVLAASQPVAILEVRPPNLTVPGRVEAINDGTVSFTGTATISGTASIVDGFIDSDLDFTNASRIDFASGSSPGDAAVLRSVSGDVINDGVMCVNAGTAEIRGNSFFHLAGSHIDIAPGAQLTFNASPYWHGSINYFTTCPPMPVSNEPSRVTVLFDLHIEEGAHVQAGAGILALAGDLDIKTTRVDRLELQNARVDLVGFAQEIEVVSENLGKLTSNRRPGNIGHLHLGPIPTQVKLVDRHDNSPGAGQEVLYAHELVLEPGTRLDLAGHVLYYGDAQIPDINNQVIDSVGGGALVRLASPTGGNNGLGQGGKHNTQIHAPRKK
ncbi:MAG: hypothetical protein RL885_15810 [Planctomycetota bacterium]